MDEQDANINATPDDEKSAPIVEQQKDTISVAEIDKESQSIVATAHKTFRELHISLDSQQTKLMELEGRRRALQEEMMRLKAELAKEKNCIQDKLKQSESALNYETPYEEMDETEAIETGQINHNQHLDEDTSIDAIAQDVKI